jgi:HSP20 family molecular chaperone IbpA
MDSTPRPRNGCATTSRPCPPKRDQVELANALIIGNGYRRFTLPWELDESTCEATYHNGVFEIKLVRKTAAPGKRLAIR